MVNSKIAFCGGVPTLFVNDEPIAGVAYITYFTDNNRYEDFSKAGFKLFSVPVFFGKQTINEVSQFPPFMDGVYDGGVHYEVFDREIQRILSVAPDAMIFPRVNCSVPKEWEDAHAYELCDSCHRACFASDLWAEETERLLTDFIQYVQNSEYADNIIGYQIAGGNTEEWFSFDQKGSVGLRAREKYAKITGTFYSADDDYTNDKEFYGFLSRTVAERIDRFAAVAKRIVGGKKVVGAFYGYTFECPWPSSVHLALGEILRSENVDFICSPASYMETRRFGIDHPCMLPIDSLKKHGKLYFVENDLRTDLSRPPNDQPHYNKPIWFGPDRATSLEVLKQGFARALLHGHALWWFDMWGGWYAADEYMDFMKRTLNIAAESLNCSRVSHAEVAVFIDEMAMLSYNAMSEAYHFRRSLGLMGAAYDVYLIEDYADVKEKYKYCIFIQPTETEAMTNAVKDGKHMIITKDNCDITSAELRELLRDAGVTLRTDTDAVVYETESHIFIGGTDAHLIYDGDTELLLGGIGRLYRKI